MLKDVKIRQTPACDCCQRNRYPVHCPMAKQFVEACKHYIFAKN